MCNKVFISGGVKIVQHQKKAIFVLSVANSSDTNHRLLYNNSTLNSRNDRFYVGTMYKS